MRSVIRPALKSGKVVLCDRFTDSTLAYQGHGRGLDLDCLREAIDFSTDGLVPDATIYLDIPIETSYRRGRGDEFGDAFFRRVEAGFRKLAEAEPKRIRVVGGQDSVEAVAAKVLQNLESVVFERA